AVGRVASAAVAHLEARACAGARSPGWCGRFEIRQLLAARLRPVCTRARHSGRGADRERRLLWRCGAERVCELVLRFHVLHRGVLYDTAAYVFWAASAGL